MPRLTRKPFQQQQMPVFNPRHHYGRYMYRSNPYENAPQGAPESISKQIDRLLDGLAALEQAAVDFSNFDYKGLSLTRWQKALLVSSGAELAYALENVREEFDSVTLRAFGEKTQPLDVFKRRQNPYVDEGRIGTHWGSSGSGILYAYKDKLLLLQRSPSVMDGGTWGIPGGAIPVNDAGKPADAYKSALREAREELGSLPPGDRKPVEKHVYADPDSSFTYTTFTVELPRRAYVSWTPTLNWEHTDWGWYTASEALMNLDLHPGVADLLSRS